ncbi:MAG: TIR domain-containing protein [Bacteroidota bacterium]
MNNSIFSYSIKDAALVMRIYDDIDRSGGHPWRFELDNKTSGNFEASFKKVLKQSKYFILIDSQEARCSEIVKKECKWAEALLNDPESVLSKIIVCITEQDGDWRKTDLLLKKIEKYSYIDFSGYDQFDQFDKYKKSIHRLCGFIGLDYKPWTTVPRASDFQKELFEYSGKEMSIDDRNFLINDYENFQSSIHMPQGHAQQRILWIIERCELLQIKIISVFLAQGVLAANNDRFVESRQAFQLAVDHFPGDPRGWAGLAAAFFYLGNYNKALDGYNHTIGLINQHKHLFKHQDRLADILHNKVETLIRMEQLEEADDTISSIATNKRQLPEVKIAEIKLRIKQKRYDEAASVYAEIQYLLEFKHLNDVWLNKLLASLEREMARLVYYYNNREEAIYHLKLAIELDPEENQYKDDLAQITKKK